MSSTFSAGDVVRLKTGSPKMTVSSVSGRSIACVWFKPSTFVLPSQKEIQTWDGPFHESFSADTLFLEP
jgi:uncharacterized protein YodC (DUF2158 family)